MSESVACYEKLNRVTITSIFFTHAISQKMYIFWNEPSSLASISSKISFKKIWNIQISSFSQKTLILDIIS
jgi:hypothetical protein